MPFLEPSGVRYNFPAEFLRVRPPDTSFGDAWESLCHALLAADTGDPCILRLGPPDRGIDLLRRASGDAYHCKAAEQGAGATLGCEASIRSLAMAVAHRRNLPWDGYAFATNARYTVIAVERVLEAARASGLSDRSLQFLGPQYWSDLCEQHPSSVAHLLDYRLSFTEDEVLGALSRAGYFAGHVQECQEEIRQARYRLFVRNNRTPIIVDIPFSPRFTVEKCVGVVSPTAIKV